ncbi:DUF192 domain-containing protein [Phenylobacterium sp. LjRoot219]|uniref:DUF192 domain-containing protein n=1 Tax=Phenylobacterium sp. LjRoot219 TaxID=3342283 RepID=UPI003ED17501
MPYIPRAVRRSLIAAAVLLAGAGAAYAAPAPSSRACEAGAGQAELKPLQPLSVTTSRGRFNFQVENADTPQEREIGMMCRKGLAADRGMLFDFGKPTNNVAFWMRNTLIPLDIVFIRPDGRVLSIARSARPLDETPLPAGGQIRAVLELAAGRAAQIGLLPGDKVVHRIFPQ